MAEHLDAARLRRVLQIRARGELGPEETTFLDDLLDRDIFWHGSGHSQFAATLGTRQQVGPRIQR